MLGDVFVHRRLWCSWTVCAKRKESWKMKNEKSHVGVSWCLLLFALMSFVSSDQAG